LETQMGRGNTGVHQSRGGEWSVETDVVQGREVGWWPGRLFIGARSSSLSLSMPFGLTDPTSVMDLWLVCFGIFIFIIKKGTRSVIIQISPANQHILYNQCHIIYLVTNNRCRNTWAVTSDKNIKFKWNKKILGVFKVQTLSSFKTQCCIFFGQQLNNDIYGK
jgi:hypothetical protein